jgi:hypothetical protein
MRTSVSIIRLDAWSPRVLTAARVNAIRLIELAARSSAAIRALIPGNYARSPRCVLELRGMYPQYARHWLNPSEALQLKEFFYLASCEITSRLDQNPHVDERGLTDELVRVLTNRKGPLVLVLQDRLSKSKARIDLKLHETNIKDEGLLGADLGVVLRIATDDVQYQTSALFQAKRLHPEGDEFKPFCSYGLEHHRSRKQSEKMRQHNSASFFILYNPSLFAGFSRCERSKQLQEAVERHLSYWDKYYEDAKSKFGESITLCAIPKQLASIFEVPFDPCDGICVLPAGFVNHARPSSLRAQTVHRYTVSFTDFIVDDLIQGKVGDSTKNGIDVAQGKNRNFEVRYSLGLELRSGRFLTNEALYPLFR